MSASNKAIVQRFFEEGLNNRDFSVLTELVGDCIYHMPLVGELRGEALKWKCSDLRPTAHGQCLTSKE
jgi:hypothetical protein